MHTGYNNPTIQTNTPRTATAKRVLTAKIRIPRLVEDIRNDHREAESGFRSCESLEEQLYQELRVFHHGRGPWSSTHPDGGTTTAEEQAWALSELQEFENLDRQRAYELIQLVLARVLVPAA